ncbi:type VII secretion target [Williamsia sp. M5A3_1d]
MPDNLEVDPVSLRHVGRQLNQGAEEGGEAFVAQHGQLTAAAAGLFGKARSAMEQKADTWRTRAADITSAIDDHGTRLHTSAALYETTDGDTSTALYRAGDDGQPKLNLKA